MAENTAIEWADATVNFWAGCSKVSPACDHCYAERMAGRLWGVKWGAGEQRLRFEGAAETARALNRKAERTGKRLRVFCNSMSDVFDNEVDPAWRRDLFALIEKTPNLDWLLLTKRIGNVRSMAPMGWLASSLHGPGGRVLHAYGWPSNVWLGATICNREEMLRDGLKLKATPARVRFWSVEPMLGDLGEIPRELMPDWVIVGGESGPKARPMHPDWVRSLRDQCNAAGVAFHFKQWGEWATVAESPVHPEATRIPGNLCKVTRDGTTADHYVAISTDGGRRRYELRRVGKKAAGRLLDGREWSEVPA